MAESISPNDPGHGPLIISLSWILTTLATGTVALRFYVRKKFAGALSSDDWLMLAAIVLDLAFQGCLTKAYQVGLGKHDASLTYDEAVQLLKWDWISTTPAIMVSIVARISIAVLLTRIFAVKTWFKTFLIYFTTLQSIVASVLIIIVWVQVSPIQGLWDPLLPARRWDTSIQQNMAYTTQALFTFSDLTYVLFPIMIIFRLQMPRRQQIGLGILMAASLLTMAASIMKAVNAQSSSATDAAYDASTSVLWSAIEQSLVIIMGCVPPLRALSKLEFPALRTFGESLASLVGRGSANRSRSNLKSGTSAAYHDLELESGGRVAN